MTHFLESGLLKRIEAPEGNFAFPPEVCGIAEHVEQLLARFAIESKHGSKTSRGGFVKR